MISNQNFISYLLITFFIFMLAVAIFSNKIYSKIYKEQMQLEQINSK